MPMRVVRHLRQVQAKEQKRERQMKRPDYYTLHGRARWEVEGDNWANRIGVTMYLNEHIFLNLEQHVTNVCRFIYI